MRRPATVSIVLIVIFAVSAVARPTFAGRLTVEGDKKPSAKQDAKQPDAAKKPDSAEKGAAKASPAAKSLPKTGEAKPCDKPSTYKVKKRLFKVEVSLDGVLEAKNTTDIVLRPKEWSDFEVLRAVEHGTLVKPGDLLVSLETEKIDKAIADLQRDLTLARLALQDSELQLQLTRASVPLDLAASERSRRNLDQDAARFQKIDRPMMIRMVNFMVKMSEDQLAYEQEELRQLEKMYKADDLTEETEEIILRRARDSVARAKFGLDRAKSERDSILEMSLPRAEEALKLALQRQAIEYRRSQASIPAGLRKQELTLEKARVELGRSEERLKRLEADRGLMNVKAPVGGIVYYGKFVRGRWSGSEMVADRLRRGGHLMSDDVFMTIVEPRPLAVRTSASEKQLQWVTTGQKAVVRPTATPDLRLSAIVDRVAAVPGGGKDFETTLTLALDEQARALMPGMTCEVKLVPYLKRDALAIPLAALGTDEIEGAKQLVALPGKGDQPIKREVTVGKRSDKLVEIVAGLREGEEILAEYPKEKE
jgi:multidrug resistance efflux pump